MVPASWLNVFSLPSNCPEMCKHFLLFKGMESKIHFTPAPLYSNVENKKFLGKWSQCDCKNLFFGPFLSFSDTFLILLNTENQELTAEEEGGSRLIRGPQGSHFLRFLALLPIYGTFGNWWQLLVTDGNFWLLMATDGN